MAQRAYRPPPSGAASLSAFERFIQQPVLRSAPPGPPSRQWLARQQQLSTQPMGLGAVAGLPTQGPAEEELAPLPPSREVEELPRGRGAVGKRSVDARAAGGSYLRLPPTGVSSMAPGSPFEGGVSPIREPGGIGGERVLSTLRDRGIGLLGETEEDMNARLTREDVAEGLGISEGLAKAVGAGLMKPDAAVRQHAADMKRADDAAEASFQREKTETQERLKTESDFRELDALLRDKGYSERDAFLQASRAANAGKAEKIVDRLRKERAERKAAEAKAEATRSERGRLALTLPGAVGPGTEGPEPASVAAFRAGGSTYPGALAAGRAEQRLPQRAAAYGTLRRRGEAPEGLTAAEEADYNKAKAIVGGSAFVRRGEETAADMIRRLMEETASQ